MGTYPFGFQEGGAIQLDLDSLHLLDLIGVAMSILNEQLLTSTHAQMDTLLKLI